MSRLTLLEPAEINNPTKGRIKTAREGYAGVVRRGDEMYFHHVSSCCAVMVFGDKVLVGGHMGEFWGDETGAKNIAAAGRKVWTLIAAEHARQNSKGGALLMVGAKPWFTEVSANIIEAIKPAFCRLYATDNFANSVNISVVLSANAKDMPINIESCESGDKASLQEPDTYDTGYQCLM